MKKILITLIIFLPLLCLGGCSKDDDKPADPVDLLPPATQVGANTVGCLVNGEVFLPKGGGLSGNKNCFYQFVDERYHFGLQFSNFSSSGARSVLLGSQDAEIEEGQTYMLNAQPFFVNNEPGRGGGYSYINYDAGIEDYYSTTPEVTGEMTITKLDFENNNVSGTFWFDAINEDGEIVEIREGRFDMRFTQ